MRSKFWILGTMLTALSLPACGGDDPAGPGEDEVEVIGEVDGSGGDVASSDGKVRMSFPAGAVSQGTEITVEPVESPPATEGFMGGTAYDFGPEGITFAEPVTVEIEFDASEIPGGVPLETVAIHKLVGSSWNRVPGGSVDAARSVARAQVTSFSVYGVVYMGAPASAEVEGDGQTAATGQALATAPGVVVLSERGVPLPGLDVTFQADGGTVTGGSQVTDESGRATVGSWVMPDTPGTYGLTVMVEGMSGTAGTISATAYDPCETAPAISIGTTVESELGAGSCLEGGRLQNFRTLSLGGMTQFVVTMDAGAFSPFTGVFEGESQVSGRASDPGKTATAEHALPAGTYRLFATSFETGETDPPTGAYTLSLSSVGELQAGCISVAAMTHGSSASANITSSDCEDEYDQEPEVVRWWDGYAILLFPGESVTVTASADFVHRFTYWRGSSYADGNFGVAAGGSSTLSVTASEIAFYYFYVISDTHQGTGSYTISFSSEGAGASPAARMEGARGASRLLAIPPGGMR